MEWRAVAAQVPAERHRLLNLDRQHPDHLGAGDVPHDLPRDDHGRDAQLGGPLQERVPLRLLPPQRHLGGGDRDRLRLGVLHQLRPGERPVAGGGHRPDRLAEHPVGHQDRHRDADDLAVDRLQRDHLPRRPADHP
ncbi:hypothetical protein ACRAWF_43745 [Streptomyces sp. L7]